MEIVKKSLLETYISCKGSPDAPQKSLDFLIKSDIRENLSDKHRTFSPENNDEIYH